MALLDHTVTRLHDPQPRDRPAGSVGALRRRFPKTSAAVDRSTARIKRLATGAHWFGAFLDVANNILKSLGAVVPVEGIREFKDAVKAVVSAF